MSMKVATNAAVIRLLIGMTAITLVFVYFLAGFGSDQSTTPPNTVFTTETGIEIGDDWQLIASGDDHGGFVGDGETYFVFSVPTADIENLLASPALWSNDWLHGPVDHAIGYHCGFGIGGVGYSSSSNGTKEYSGHQRLASLLSSTQIRYDAKERCCESLRWHNGHLLIVDPENGKIWLSVWDF